MKADDRVAPKHCGDNAWLVVPECGREVCRVFYRPDGVGIPCLSCLFLPKTCRGYLRPRPPIFAKTDGMGRASEGKEVLKHML